MEPPVPGHETSHNEDYDDVTNRVRRAALDISSCILELSAKFKHYVQHQQWDCVTELSAAVRQTLRISKTFPPNDERADSDPTELVVMNQNVPSKSLLPQRYLERCCNVYLFCPGVADSEFQSLQAHWQCQATQTVPQISNTNSEAQKRMTLVDELKTAAFRHWLRIVDQLRLSRRPHRNWTRYMSCWLSLEQSRNSAVVVVVGSQDPARPNKSQNAAGATLGEQVYTCLRRQLDAVVSQLGRDRSLVLMVVSDDLATLNAFAVVCQVINRNGPWLKRDSIVQFFLLQPLEFEDGSGAPCSAAEFTESSDAVLRRFAGVQCRRCNRTSLADDPSNAKLKTCARCKSTRYCSIECQRLDWPRHKPECEPVWSDSIDSKCTPFSSQCGYSLLPAR